MPPKRMGVSLARPPLLSVVVPIGSMAGKLDQLFQWVKEIQNHSSQVVLVVDEKGDGTYIELLNYLMGLELKSEVILLNDYCNGPGNARNLGLKVASGRWIVFWDSDDAPVVSETYNAINSSPENAKVIIGRYREIDVKHRVHHSRNRYIEVGMNPGIWRIIIRREILQLEIFPNLKLGEDQVFIVKNHILGLESYFHDGFIYNYRASGDGQLTNSTSYDSDLLAAFRLILEFLRSDESISFREKSIVNLMGVRLFLTALKRRQYKELRVGDALHLPKLFFNALFSLIFLGAIHEKS